MPTVNTIELSGLEYQVDHLLRALEQLKIENNTLRQKLANSVRERGHLIEKNGNTIAKIKTIIAQLKEDMS